MCIVLWGTKKVNRPLSLKMPSFPKPFKVYYFGDELKGGADNDRLSCRWSYEPTLVSKDKHCMASKTENSSRNLITVGDSPSGYHRHSNGLSRIVDAISLLWHEAYRSTSLCALCVWCHLIIFIVAVWCCYCYLSYNGHEGELPGMSE